MKKRHLPLLIAALLTSASLSASEEEGNLITLMGNFQYFMHKTALSLDANNPELVKFYAHEIEETLEEAEHYGDYDGFNIGAMIKQTITPEFESFEARIDNNDLDGADHQFNKIIESCNSCHQSTQKSYLKIERTSGNPFMQSFEN